MKQTLREDAQLADRKFCNATARARSVAERHFFYRIEYIGEPNYCQQKTDKTFDETSCIWHNNRGIQTGYSNTG